MSELLKWIKITGKQGRIRLQVHLVTQNFLRKKKGKVIPIIKPGKLSILRFKRKCDGNLISFKISYNFYT